MTRLLGGLPPWAQVLVLLVLVGLAVVVGRRKRRTGAKPRSRSGGARATIVPRGEARSPMREPDTDESPGQTGAAATRDLDAREIGRLSISYSPRIDGDPDPGEVVWTWVPYVEHNGEGKDRPVLIIARIDDETFAACYLTTKEHRGFISIGSGGWDSQGRESFLSPDRILRVHRDGMRREGQVLAEDRFARAAGAIAARYGLEL
ncbi:MAG: hypothetical protein KDB25_07375 [Leucobacter sp.]|nr:hypothetical protein [Leucobacter sp.]